MKKISWRKAKGGRAFEHLLEGFVDGKLAFVKEGGLCLSDIRDLGGLGDDFVPPKHYPLTNETDKLAEAKLIAHELLNGINLDVHENSRKSWEDRHTKTANLIKEAEEFLKSLKS